MAEPTTTDEARRQLRALADEDAEWTTRENDALADRNAPLTWYTSQVQRHQMFREARATEALWLLVRLAADKPGAAS